jgi:hypothetical protein
MTLRKVKMIFTYKLVYREIIFKWKIIRFLQHIVCNFIIIAGQEFKFNRHLLQNLLSKTI